MKKLFRKLHSSEVLLLAGYAVILASIFLVEDGAAQDLIIITFLGIVLLSFWSVGRHRAISPVLYPFYIFLGLALGTLLVSFAGSSNAPAAIGAALFLIFFVIAFLELVWGLIFAIKDVYKALILMVLSFLIILALDVIFISPSEMGEKGPSYYQNKYSDWRVLEKD